ncbi:MAG: efflux RND transporter permease subunit, partial [Burkholderiales bacterium]
RELRRQLNRQFPDTEFAFLPADIVSQILNFGLPAPVDIQIAGFNVKADHLYANHLLQSMGQVPGMVDQRIQQRYDYPQINVDVDRTRASLLGLTENDVARNLLITLSGSFQTNPTFWVDPKTGVQYSIATQAPQYRMQNLNDLSQMPVTNGEGHLPQLLSNLADFHRSVAPAVVTHYNVKPVFDIYANVADRDLGGVASDIERIIAKAPALPKGSSLNVRGQVSTMQAAFHGLAWGLVAAIVLIYLLIVINFQSWLDPFIIITALPAALAGILWMLFLTGTHISVPALTGAIMCMGVATANSILVVSFARERMNMGENSHEAAISAGFARMRPVLMTALAMIIGMLPMALGLGEGGEQNAPLGRAVIGGLMLATVATLFFVPTIFALIHRKPEHDTQRKAENNP